jgi:hypothetical protein
MIETDPTYQEEDIAESGSCQRNCPFFIGFEKTLFNTSQFTMSASQKESVGDKKPFDLSWPLSGTVQFAVPLLFLKGSILE